jgi:hypothetical protein
MCCYYLALSRADPYREMFTANFRRGLEREAQLCVYVGERRVVDLWGSATGDKEGRRHIRK